MYLYNIYMYVYMYVCMYVCMYICIYVCMYICIYEHMYICTYVHMYMYVCIYTCIYMYASIHTYKQVKSFKDLGITYSDSCYFNAHIVSIVKPAKYLIQLLFILFLIILLGSIYTCLLLMFVHYWKWIH